MAQLVINVAHVREFAPTEIRKLCQQLHPKLRAIFSGIDSLAMSDVTEPAREALRPLAGIDFHLADQVFAAKIPRANLPINYPYGQILAVIAHRVPSLWVVTDDHFDSLTVCHQLDNLFERELRLLAFGDEGRSALRDVLGRISDLTNDFDSDGFYSPRRAADDQTSTDPRG